VGSEPWSPDEHGFANLVEAMADAVAVIDAAGVLRYANPAAEQLFGYPLAERRGRAIFDLVHPDDLDIVLRSLVQRADTHGPGDPLEVRVRAGDGQWVHVEVVTTNRLADERFGGMILSIRDITHRRTLPPELGHRSPQDPLTGLTSRPQLAAGSVDIREELERGFRADAVEVHYQPVVDTATGRPVGLEALARWRHRTLGLLRPGDFLEVAEEMGLASALDWCVLERVALDRARWRIEAPGLVELPLSVNITVAEVGLELEQRLESFLASPGGAGTRLNLELTERAMLRSVDSVSATLERLKERGIGLTVDASGAGYSTLPHLHRLPIRLVKLDRSFLASVTKAGSESTAAFVELYAALDVHVVAVGVETFEQHQVVRSMGIKWAQGFFYAEPRDPAELASLVTAGQPAPPEQAALTSDPVGPSR
jgi:PAS domain S-box-containing protein